MSIQVTLNFTSEADLLAFFANKKAVMHQPGLPLESGEFLPAAEVNKAAKVAAPKPAATPAAPAPAPKEAAAPAPAAESPSDPKPSAAAPAAEAQPSAASTAAPADSQTGTVDYPTLQKAVFTLAGKSREAAAAVAASFGVKTFKELDASKWGDALAAVNTKIAEL